MSRVRLAKRHMTCIPEARLVREQARSLPGVTAVAAGLIKPVRPGRRRVKFTEISGGLLVAVRGVSAVQAMRIYAHDLRAVTKELADLALREGWTLG